MTGHPYAIVSVVNRTMIAAPLAVLVLTVACGPTKTAAPNATFSEPAPSVSPVSGPALKRIWHIPGTGAQMWDENVYGTATIGNTVVATAANSQLDFIDGTTGRITGRVPGLGINPTAPAGDTIRYVSPATDGQGRPLVVVHTGEASAPIGAWPDDDKPGLERVYDTAGRLIWKSATDGARYDGGYVAEPQAIGHQNSLGKDEYRMTIRTTSGRVVAHWPLPVGRCPTTILPLPMEMTRPRSDTSRPYDRVCSWRLAGRRGHTRTRSSWSTCPGRARRG